VLPFTAQDPLEWVHCHIARQPVAPDQYAKEFCVDEVPGKSLLDYATVEGLRFVRLKQRPKNCGASTSSFTVPKVVSGLWPNPS
jgi:hypothetical protein